MIYHRLSPPDVIQIIIYHCVASPVVNQTICVALSVASQIIIISASVVHHAPFLWPPSRVLLPPSMSGAKPSASDSLHQRTDGDISEGAAEATQQQRSISSRWLASWWPDISLCASGGWAVAWNRFWRMADCMHVGQVAGKQYFRHWPEYWDSTPPPHLHLPPPKKKKEYCCQVKKQRESLSD